MNLCQSFFLLLLKIDNNMNRYLAFIICALVGLLSFITYLNMLVPIENEIELGQNLTESEYEFEEKIKFEMTDGMYEKIAKYEFTNGVRNTK